MSARNASPTSMVPATPAGRRRRVGNVLPPLLVVLALLLGSCGQAAGVRPPTEAPTSLPIGTPPSEGRARELLGPVASGGTWFSGAWPGGELMGTERARAFGEWRGTPTDAVTTYPAYETWQEIHESRWHITTFDDFDGILVYGLPMLPKDGDGSFRTILAGEHDWVYRRVAQDLLDHDRGRSVVRIGWEANGNWFPWKVKAATADQYVAAFRHITFVLRSVAPELVIDFDVNCGTPLPGQSDRLDTLTKLYPGDDVVDLVGCDTYDWFDISATDEQTWAAAKRPKASPGLQDVADFARAHGKGLTVPEWGLASKALGGRGDNPYYIDKLRGFFEDNADVLVLESYFNEPIEDIRNSLWSPTQHPRAAEVYVERW